MDKSFIISIIAIVISIISLYKSIKSASGQIEIYIRNMITSARNRYEDLAINSNATAPVLDSALENLLNTYDEACAKYLDGKVDKGRFKKLYYTEIKNLVEDNNTKPHYDTIDSKFQATIKVYDEWNNLEK